MLLNRYKPTVDPTDHAWLKVFAKAIKGLKSDTIGILLDYNFNPNSMIEIFQDKYHDDKVSLE